MPLDMPGGHAVNPKRHPPKLGPVFHPPGSDNYYYNMDWSAFQDGTSLSSIVIPSSVTAIGVNAFEGCSSLSSVVMPKSLEDQKDEAFPDYMGEIQVSE